VHFNPYGQKTHPAWRYLKIQVFQWGRIYRRGTVGKLEKQTFHDYLYSRREKEVRRKEVRPG
jgi:hypothetical protein